jgi:hypothetical protein
MMAREEDPGCCDRCRELTTGEDGRPLVMPLSWWEKNGTNVGRKKAEWKATICTIHPNCRGVPRRIPQGWSYTEDGELTPRLHKAEKLHGGEADGIPDSEFDADDLAEGTKHEGEHTDDPKVAKEIAKDHLKEDKDYYRKLEKSYKLHYSTEFQGLPVSIENRKGSLRHWTDHETGEEGSTRMLWPYGYIRLTEGPDGDHQDVFIGPNPDATHAYVVHQLKAPEFKEWDEDKTMLGFDSPDEAHDAYLAHYTSPKFFGGMTILTVEEFKAKVGESREHPDRMIKSDSLPGQIWDRDLGGSTVHSGGHMVTGGRLSPRGSKHVIDEQGLLDYIEEAVRQRQAERAPRVIVPWKKIGAIMGGGGAKPVPKFGESLRGVRGETRDVDQARDRAELHLRQRIKDQETGRGLTMAGLPVDDE